MIVRVILRSLIVGFAIMIGAVIASVYVGGMIYSVFFLKNTSASGTEVAWDLRTILHYYLGAIWTAVLFFALFLCGFVWALRHFTRSPR